MKLTYFVILLIFCMPFFEQKRILKKAKNGTLQEIFTGVLKGAIKAFIEDIYGDANIGECLKSIGNVFGAGEIADKAISDNVLNASTDTGSEEKGLKALDETIENFFKGTIGTVLKVACVVKDVIKTYFEKAKGERRRIFVQGKMRTRWVWKWLTSIWDNVKSFVKDSTYSVLQSAKSKLDQASQEIIKGLKNAADLAKWIGTQIKETITDVINTISAKITEFVNYLKRIYNTIITWIKEKIEAYLKSIFGTPGIGNTLSCIWNILKGGMWNTGVLAKPTDETDFGSKMLEKITSTGKKIINFYVGIGRVIAGDLVAISDMIINLACGLDRVWGAMKNFYFTFTVIGLDNKFENLSLGIFRLIYVFGDKTLGEIIG